MAVERNSDGSYDAVDSGGFGKDYHGQDAFGERIGGNHFGGFEEGHFGVGDGRDHFEREATSYGDITQTEVPAEVPDTSAFEGEEETGSDMRDSVRDLNSKSEENSNTGGSMDTSFQIGGIEENEAAKEKVNSAKQKMDNLKQSLGIAEERKNGALNQIDKLTEGFNKAIDEIGKTTKPTVDKTVSPKYTLDFLDKISETAGEVENFAKEYGFGVDEETKAKMVNPSTAADAMRDVIKGVRDIHDRMHTKAYDDIKSKYDGAKSEYESAKAEYDKQLESSFTDRMKESKKSDYETKANKDSTKEMPKDYRNDFGNHAQDTLNGVVDRIADNTTAEALGLKSVEEFAKEHGYNPNKLSTMKAYMQYQNKEIMKAIPGVVKQVGGYIVERIKDAFDPSQLTERIRNTIARYNLATLVGAAILSMNSGSGIQNAIDQALTMVDTEDQPAVSDFLEDVFKDRDTVKDLSNAIDGALAPEENSNTTELDKEIVNIGRKNNTDYDDFNAGLGTTTSDADVKVFIARNIKADPILRRMVENLGK